MSERELAKNMAYAAEYSMNNIDLKYKGAIIDYQDNFGNGELNFRLFVDECDNLGYDVLPIENTPYALMAKLCGIGKLVVEKRCSNGKNS